MYQLKDGMEVYAKGIVRRVRVGLGHRDDVSVVFDDGNGLKTKVPADSLSLFSGIYRKTLGDTLLVPLPPPAPPKVGDLVESLAEDGSVMSRGTVLATHDDRAWIRLIGGSHMTVHVDRMRRVYHD